MTRRTVIFTDMDGNKYASPEFNGDKSEFILFLKNHDACDADWPDIFKEFDGVTTLQEFKDASKRAQLHYRSFINNAELERELLPVCRIDGADINSGMVESGNTILLN